MFRAPDLAVGLIDDWIRKVRLRVATAAPDLLPTYDLYANEARFGRMWLNTSLRALPAQAKLAEIGGGLLLLSCQLVREGFDVTVIEPIGTGFSAFERLQSLVLAQAEADNIVPVVITRPVEQLDITDAFDFAFSVNVMEHVGSVGCALANVLRSLKPQGAYRFTCPNYHFPYEPHFNIPLIFSKSVTEKIFGQRIMAYDKLTDPKGIWESLNWIDTSSIQSICDRIGGNTVSFARMTTSDAIVRITNDPEFAQRRPGWAPFLAGLLVNLGLHRIPSALPARFHPIIDCTVRRTVVGK